MQCFYCKEEIDEKQDSCPFCKSSLKAYKMILTRAELFYNDGLEKAKVRDLSGAVDSLNMCLHLNKKHIPARNLLGLVYFEEGNMVQALSEWVISKNYCPKDNIVDAYLNEIQNTPGMLDKMDQTIRKYNQALAYCRDGNRDLAKIQLRRVLGMNEKMVEGHQLLALLAIMDKDYEEARKELNAANKIDARNATSLKYMTEVKNLLKEQNASRKKRKKDDIITFQDGNDSVMMPNKSFRDLLDDSRSSVVNILVGLILGILVCFFLIVPTVQQNAKSDTASALVNANEKVTSSSNSISSLKSQVESLQSQLANYTGKDDVKTSYENTIAAYNALQGGDTATASSTIASVNQDLLGDNAKTLYQAVMAEANKAQTDSAFAAGYKAYWAKDYATAITNFTTVNGLNESYENGKNLYYLADSYLKSSDNTNARTYFARYVELFPKGTYAKKANKAVAAIDAGTATPQTTGSPSKSADAASSQTTQDAAANAAGTATTDTTGAITPAQ